MNTPVYLSVPTATYLQSASLGAKATAADAEDKDINSIIDERTTLTDKARYMNANISSIQAIIQTFEAGVVGIDSDIQFKFRDKKGILDKKLNDQVEKDWKLFCKKEFFSATKLLHFSGTLRDIVKAEVGTEGEIIVLHLFNTAWKYGYKTKLVETSMIDTTKDRPAEYDNRFKTKTKKTKNAIVGGIELGDYEEHIGIWIFDNKDKANSTFYTEGQYTLYFNQTQRTSQIRGITPLSGVIGTIQNTLTYTDTELKTAGIAAETKYVHTTPLIKPLREKQKQFWEARYQKDDIPTISDFGAEDQANSPTMFIGMDEKLDKLDSTNRDSTYSTFLSNRDNTLASNYNISNNTLLKGDGKAVFAIVKANKQENETRFGISRNNLINKVVDDIVNNFVLINHSKWKIKDFYDDKYKYLYQFKITLGTKTELDEVKSANARKINIANESTSVYDAAQELGNDYDSVLEANTRATIKKVEELKKILTELKTLNEASKEFGISFKLDENNNIVQNETIIDAEVIETKKEEVQK